MKHIEAFNYLHTEWDGQIFNGDLLTSPGNLKACRAWDDIVKHVQWLKEFQSGCAMKRSRVGKAQTVEYQNARVSPLQAVI